MKTPSHRHRYTIAGTTAAIAIGIALLVSVKKAEPDEGRRTGIQCTRTDEIRGPAYNSVNIRALRIGGIHLGMAVDQAQKILRDDGAELMMKPRVVPGFPSPFEIAGAVGWSDLPSAYGLRPEAIPIPRDVYNESGVIDLGATISAEGKPVISYIHYEEENLNPGQGASAALAMEAKVGRPTVSFTSGGCLAGHVSVYGDDPNLSALDSTLMLENCSAKGRALDDVDFPCNRSLAVRSPFLRVISQNIRISFTLGSKPNQQLEAERLS